MWLWWMKITTNLNPKTFWSMNQQDTFSSLLGNYQQAKARGKMCCSPWILGSVLRLYEYSWQSPGLLGYQQHGRRRGRERAGGPQLRPPLTGGHQLSPPLTGGHQLSPPLNGGHQLSLPLTGGPQLIRLWLEDPSLAPLWLEDPSLDPSDWRTPA